MVTLNQPVPQVVAVGRAAPSDGALLALAVPTDGPGRVRQLLGEVAGLALPDDVVGAMLRRSGFVGGAGSTLAVPDTTSAQRGVLLMGTGEGSPGELRAAGAATRRAAIGYPRLVVQAATAGAVAAASGDGLAALVEGLLLAGYRYRLRTDSPDGAQGPERIEVVTGDEAGLARAVSRTRAVLLARDLVNTPSLTKTPSWLADQAVAVAGAGLQVTVFDEQRLADEGFGGILGVGRGSTRPPRLVRLEHRPGGASRHVVLVGKGITFDSGGLSLKPNDGMVSMKTDMGGAAAVLAAMSALAELEVPVAVTGLLACAENMPSGSATRPGDVLRHYGGRTVEVLNTDAEGRLVMADALAYADAELAPDVVVDLATLTGAMPVALGKGLAGMFASDDGLAEALLGAGAGSGEPVWRMPLVADYRQALESPVADLRNVGDRTLKLQAGSITAALFLREFTGGRPWAHLDIAGTGRSDGDKGILTPGGTGWGVRLLLRWLEAGASA